MESTLKRKVKEFISYSAIFLIKEVGIDLGELLLITAPA